MPMLPASKAVEDALLTLTLTLTLALTLTRTRTRTRTLTLTLTLTKAVEDALRLSDLSSPSLVNATRLALICRLG